MSVFFQKQQISRHLLGLTNGGWTGVILDRYVQLSKLDEALRDDIYVNENQFITHTNFTLESVCAYFQNPRTFGDGKSVSQHLLEHLDKPDQYLRDVFYNLGKNNKN